MNLLIIIFNSLIHFGITFYYYKKEGLSLRSFLWLYLSVFTLGGVVFLGTGLYIEIMDSPHFSYNEIISPKPYLLNLLYTYIILCPLGLVKPERIVNQRLRNDISCFKISRIVMLVEFIYTIIKVSQVFVVVNYGFGNFHDLGPKLQEEILYGSVPLLQYINYIGKFVAVVVFPYILVYHFILWKNTHKNYNYLKFLLLLFAINSVLVGLVAGSRAEICFGFMNVLLFGILAKPWIKIKFKGIFFAVIIVFYILSLFKSIASERFSGSMEEYNILRYWGEAYLNLGFEVWNHVTSHTYGICSFGDFLNVAPEFKYLISGINTWWFLTGYGYLFVDFGPIIPIFIALTMSLAFKLYIGKKKQISLDKIAMILFYFQMCYHHPFEFSYKRFDVLIFFLILLFPKLLNNIFLYRRSN